jgi:rod shape-determining protein MreC
MDFLQRRKKYKIFLAVVLLLIFLNIIGFSSFGQKILGGMVNSISSGLRSSSTKKSDNKATKAQLIDENIVLKSQIESKEAELANFYSLQEENEKLKKYLNFFETNSYDYVLANVVWQENLLSFSNYNQNLVINKGSDDGIRTGLAVINESGVIIGKIIEVNNKSSKLCIISNNFCKMAVTVNNFDHSIGLAEGNLGLSIKLNYVSQGETLGINDMIITSGLEPDIPPGLAVGRINFINQEVNDIWQDVNAEALFNVNNLSIISVIIPK